MKNKINRLKNKKIKNYCDIQNDLQFFFIFNNIIKKSSITIPFLAEIVFKYQSDFFYQILNF